MSEELGLECGACGFTGPLSKIFSKWGYDILECPRCGTARTAIPADFDPSTIYSESYYQGGRSDGYGDYAGSEPVIRKEARSSLAALRAAGAACGNLLEIGCAYGYFLKEARDRFNPTGVEISDAARERANEGGLSVYPGLGAAEVAERGPYSAIVLLDCIEHLVNPVETIKAATAMATDDARILITTGDWDSALARATRRRWRLMTPPQHLFFFSRLGIDKLLGECGYQVVSVDRPWRQISAGLAAYQLTRRLRMNVALPDSLNRVGIPLNLFDCMRVVARRIA